VIKSRILPAVPTTAYASRPWCRQVWKIISRRGLVMEDPIDAIARLQLARALAASGDTAGARAAYQDFFTLWKQADTDVPLLKQARAEAAKLR
jgi:DNA-binding SARP family transcriptional activator